MVQAKQFQPRTIAGLNVQPRLGYPQHPCSKAVSPVILHPLQIRVYELAKAQIIERIPGQLSAVFKRSCMVRIRRVAHTLPGRLA